MNIGQAYMNWLFDNNKVTDIKDDEYEKEGTLYCKKCNGKRTTVISDHVVRCLCKCQTAERDMRFNHTEDHMDLGLPYRWEDTEMVNADFEKVYNRCRKYCEVAEKVKEKGIGIYLWGDKGTGKTHLSGCIAQELSKKYNVIFTSFGEIANEIRADFGQESTILGRYADADFLVIDDIGTELVQRNNQDSWLQEKVFALVNARYEAKRPTIYTSNYSLADLVNVRGFAGKTADRMNELSEVMVLKGVSYRPKIKKEREQLF